MKGETYFEGARIKGVITGEIWDSYYKKFLEFSNRGTIITAVLTTIIAQQLHLAIFQ
nr:hypothetical protein [Candidatus Sigynarchaeota archaeon]